MSTEDYNNVFYDVVRPKTFAVGRLLITGATGTMTVGEIITGTTSGATAILSIYNAAYLDLITIVGAFVSGETVTGTTSTKTATVTKVMVGRKQLALVTVGVDNYSSSITSVGTAGTAITVYYIARDKLTSISQELSIPEEYQMAVFYYVMWNLFTGVDERKSIEYERRYTMALREAIKDSMSGGVYSGQTLASYDC
uniref:Putative baseplate wedge protein n=3 Tax=viral metagenome TaxID=1070528 RepID=A0A6M3XI13_9ZZZZ